MENNLLEIKKDFYWITRIIPIHATNYLENRVIRKDMIFEQLAEKTFDNPGLLNILLKKIKIWLSQDKSEFTNCLAGYIYYLKEDFGKAKKYFLRAIERNSCNLDNWFDLAFSLYHLDEREQKLAKDILFNFDLFIKLFSNKKGKHQKISIDQLRRKARVFH